MRAPFLIAAPVIAVVLAFGSCGKPEQLNASKGSIRLAWDAPTTNTDGSTLTNLSTYRLYYGTAPGVYDRSMDIPAGSTSTTVAELNPGTTYYFAVRSFSSSGLQSDLSAELSAIAQ